jgi:hypothetical protein
MSLTASQRGSLPPNPAGSIHLSEEDMFGNEVPTLTDTPSPLCMTVPTPCPESWVACKVY